MNINDRTYLRDMVDTTKSLISLTNGNIEIQKDLAILYKNLIQNKEKLSEIEASISTLKEKLSTILVG